MALVGAARRLLLLRLAAAGDRRPLGRADAAGLPGPPPDAGEPLPALLCGTVGGLIQVALSLPSGSRRPRARREERLGRRRRRSPPSRANLTLRSDSVRHAIRFGAALAAGVAVYRLLGWSDHGFWIPLTILFVMRPERDETFRRLVLRAIGTVRRPGRRHGARRVARRRRRRRRRWP